MALSDSAAAKKILGCFRYRFKREEKARQLADKIDIYIAYAIGDIVKYAYEAERFDAIALMFLHIPKTIRISIQLFTSSD